MKSFCQLILSYSVDENVSKTEVLSIQSKYKSYKATISDTDGASLPSSGKLLDGDGTETGSQAQMVEAIARARWSILPEQN